LIIGLLKDLAAGCASDHPYEFFLAAPPLNITHGTGSPINPLAIKYERGPCRSLLPSELALVATGEMSGNSSRIRACHRPLDATQGPGAALGDAFGRSCWRSLPATIAGGTPRR
jgi:hypothetical protein